MSGDLSLMTMLEPRIRQQFFDVSDRLVQVSQDLARPLADAVELTLTAITAGARVLFVGTGTAQADALAAAALLCAGSQRPRPGLPALALGADPAMLATLTQAEGDMARALARQVQALGMPGDVLMIFEGHATAEESMRLPALAPLVEAAHAREVSVVLWSSAPLEENGSPAAEAALACMTDTDLHVPIRAERPAHRSTIARLAWHCVAEAIDNQLMGEPE